MGRPQCAVGAISDKCSEHLFLLDGYKAIIYSMGWNNYMPYKYVLTTPIYARHQMQMWQL